MLLSPSKNGPTSLFEEVSVFKDHGRPRLRVMDVRTEMLFFQDFEGLT